MNSLRIIVCKRNFFLATGDTRKRNMPYNYVIICKIAFVIILFSLFLVSFIEMLL